MELINATGLRWDPETRTMDADNDWWKTHLEVSCAIYLVYYLCVDEMIIVV